MCVWLGLDIVCHNISFLQSELEGALGKVCTCFKAHSYEQVQEAYRVLGKTQVQSSQLDDHSCHVVTKL